MRFYTIHKIVCCMAKQYIFDEDAIVTEVNGDPLF